MTIETRAGTVMRVSGGVPEKEARGRKISLIGFCDRCGTANKVYEARRD
jgi:hypothetical protein